MIKLKDITITVTQDFVDYSLKEETERKWKWTGAGPPGDALIVEYYLIKEGVAQPPKHELPTYKNWRHDFILNGDKVDAKEIGDYFNIHTQSKVEQYIESIQMDELTHFLFWRAPRPRNRRLKAGETLNITIFGYCDARLIMKNKIKSMFPERTSHYVRLNTIKNLDEGLKIEPVLV